MKVYCGKCGYFDGEGFCFAKNNVEEKDRWDKIIKVQTILPHEANKDNDCENYKPGP